MVPILNLLPILQKWSTYIWYDHHLSVLIMSSGCSNYKEVVVLTASQCNTYGQGKRHYSVWCRPHDTHESQKEKKNVFDECIQQSLSLPLIIFILHLFLLMGTVNVNWHAITTMATGQNGLTVCPGGIQAMSGKWKELKCYSGFEASLC